MWFDIRERSAHGASACCARNPGTSSLIVATLALAIGAATIGFAFADLALFRGLPVDDNAKVVSIFASDTHGSTFRGARLGSGSPRLPRPHHDARAAVGNARRPRGAHPERPVADR